MNDSQRKDVQDILIKWDEGLDRSAAAEQIAAKLGMLKEHVREIEDILYDADAENWRHSDILDEITEVFFMDDDFEDEEPEEDEDDDLYDDYDDTDAPDDERDGGEA